MIGETIPMAAQGVYSASNLIKLAKAEPTLKDAAMKIGAKVLGGAVGGAAVEAAGRPAFEKAVNVLESHITGDPEKPTISPTGQSILEAAGWGVLLSAAHDPGVSRAEVKSIVEQAPTAALKTVAADPKFRKSWKYNAKWIDDELTKRDAKDNALPETAKVLSEQATEPKPSEQPPAPISVIPSIQEQGGKVIEKDPEEQNRIAAAAYKDPNTGVVYEGKNHEEAMRNAGVPEDQIPKGEEGQSQRETENHGFTDTSGQFHSREDSQKIAEQSGQFDKVTDRPVMHASDVSDMDLYPYANQNTKLVPGAAAAGEFQRSSIIDAARDIRNQSRTGTPLKK
jgi:hypothetical protein